MIHTQLIGGRVYIRQHDAILGWLDKQIPVVKRRGDGSVYRRTHEWTGRWDAVVDGEVVGEVTSPAEGMLMIARIKELDA